MPDPESGLFGDTTLYQRLRLDISSLTKVPRRAFVKASLLESTCVAAGFAARARPQALPRAFAGGGAVGRWVGWVVGWLGGVG